MGGVGGGDPSENYASTLWQNIKYHHTKLEVDSTNSVTTFSWANYNGFWISES